MLLTIDSRLKPKLDEQFQKVGGGKGTKERKLHIPGVIILNELTVIGTTCNQTRHLTNSNNARDTYNISKRAAFQELADYLGKLTSAPRKISNIDNLHPAHGEVVSTIEITR